MRLVQRHLHDARDDLHRAGEASERREEDGEAVRRTPQSAGGLLQRSRAAARHPIRPRGRRGRRPPGAQARQRAAPCARAPAPARSRARRTFRRRPRAGAPSPHIGWRGRRRPAASCARRRAMASAASAPDGTRRIAPRPPMQTRAIRSPASMPPGCSAPQSMMVSPRAPRVTPMRSSAASSTMRSASCPARAFRLKPAISRRPSAAAIAAAPLLDQPPRLRCRRGLGDDGAERRAGAKRRAGRLPVGGPVGPVEFRHASARRGWHRRCAPPRRRRKCRRPRRELAAARLDMQREQASLGRAENVERRARPGIDLDQVPASSARRGNRRCSGRPAPPPRRCSARRPPARSRSSAAGRRAHRAAVAEWRAGRRIGPLRAEAEHHGAICRRRAQAPRPARPRRAPASSVALRRPSAPTCDPPAPPTCFESHPAPCGVSLQRGCGMPQRWQSSASAAGSVTRATVSPALPRSGQRSADAIEQMRPILEARPADDPDRRAAGRKLSSAAASGGHSRPRSRSPSIRTLRSAASCVSRSQKRSAASGA